MDLAKLTKEIGQPTYFKSDPRAGLVAVWGDRRNGSFSIERGPVESMLYEVVLMPAPRHGREGFEKFRADAEKLNKWVEENSEKIAKVLKGDAIA